jgi:DNA polymerase-3 subunit chi
MRVDFYHLAETPLERVLPSICEKLLAQGQRLLIVAGPTRLDAIDRFLWTEVPASFLPHGRDGADQPILLSPEVDPANGAANVALADGIWREEALAFERAFYFFDAVTIDEARAAWRALKGRDGIEPHYWKQSEGGRWVEGP